MRDIDKDMVLRLVEENAKKRFELIYGFDPSPPPPKKVKGQNKGKGKNQGKKADIAAVVAPSEPLADGSSSIPPTESPKPDSTRIESITSSLATTTIISTELPLVILPIPTDIDTETDPKASYYIRASQGHSIQLEGVAHLEELRDDEESKKRAGLIVHGTRWELWDVLSESITFF